MEKQKQTFTLAVDMFHKSIGRFETGGLPGIDDDKMWDIEIEVPEKFGIYTIVLEIHKWIKEYFYNIKGYKRVQDKEEVLNFFKERENLNKIIHYKDKLLSRHYYTYFDIIENGDTVYGIFLTDKYGITINPYSYDEDGTYSGIDLDSIWEENK